MIRINLLPQDRGRGRGAAFTLDKTKVIPLSVLGVVLLAALSTAMVQGARIAGLRNDVEAARAETKQYEKTIALIEEMVAKEKELNRRLSLVQTLDRDRFKTVRVMDEMARRVPRYMWLTSFKNIAPDRMAIDGYAFSNLVVSDLMSKLDKSEMFEGVELSIVQRKVVDGQNTVNFTVTSAVNHTSPDDES